MEHVIKALNAILEETHFDFEYREYARYSPAAVLPDRDGVSSGTRKQTNCGKCSEGRLKDGTYRFRFVNTRQRS